MKKLCLKLFILLSIHAIFCFYGYSQSITDSLLKELNKTTIDTTRINLLLQLSKKIEKSNADSSVTLCIEALALSNHVKSPDKKADCFKRLAETYKQKPFFEDSEIYFAKEYMRTVEKLNKPLKLADAYYTIGIAFTDVPQHDSTINNYEKAITVAENAGDTAFAMQVRNDMAETYRYSGRMEVCKDIYHSMFNYYWSRNDSMGIAKSYRGIAIVFDMAEVFDSAAYYFRKTADAFKSMNRQSNYAMSLQNLGVAYTHQQKYDLAEKVFIEAISILHKNKPVVAIYQSYLNLARVYTATGKTKQAIACADSAVQYSIRENDGKIKMISTGALANAYAAAGDFKNAYSQMLISRATEDSIVKSDRDKSLSETETRFRTKEKQSQIELLNKEEKLQQGETDKQKSLKNTFILVFILIIVLAAFAFSRFRQRVKQKQEAERARISRDLHDDVGATLGSISIYSEVAKNKFSSDNERNDVLEKIGDSSREMLDKMNDIVWSVNPKNDNAEELIHRMKNFAAVMLTPRKINFSFEPETISADQLKLGMQQRKNIFLIYKEALHNIIKYAEAKEVKVKVKMNGKDLIVEIRDDGKGFEAPPNPPRRGGLGDEQAAGAIYNGNGIKNMKERAIEIGGKFEIHSEINHGTQINLNIPV
jgi:two-component system sensor histidine kinase UhpB